MKIAGYLLGIAVFAFIIYWGGSDALSTVVSPNLTYLALGLLATVLLFVICAYRWSIINNYYEGRKVCSLTDYFVFFSLGRFAGQYISQLGGDLVVRPALLGLQSKVKFSRGVSAVVIDQAFDLFLAVFLILPSLGYLFGVIDANLVGLLFIAFGFGFSVASLSIPLPLIVGKALEKFERVRRSIARLRTKASEDKSAEQSDPSSEIASMPQGQIMSVIGLTLLKYLLLAIRFYFISLALGLQVPILIMIFGLPLVLLSLIFGIAPGALGTLEGGWYAVFSMVGVSQEETAAYLIGQRAYQILYVALIALASYLLFIVRKSVTKGDSSRV